MTVTEFPICMSCDVEMDIISRNRNDWICPSCFVPKPRPNRKPVKTFSLDEDDYLSL
jgi:predicted RNA-binding Zn-ribbon protein involved in translation (DUF1610 family)